MIIKSVRAVNYFARCVAFVVDLTARPGHAEDHAPVLAERDAAKFRPQRRFDSQACCMTIVTE